MLKLKISIHEFETPEGKFIGMNAGEFTGVFASMPVSDEDRAGMAKTVQERAEFLLGLKDDADLPDGCEMPLAEIKASIRENIVEVPDVVGTGSLSVESKTFEQVEAANEVAE